MERKKKGKKRGREERKEERKEEKSSLPGIPQLECMKQSLDFGHFESSVKTLLTDLSGSMEKPNRSFCLRPPQMVLIGNIFSLLNCGL